MVRLLLISAIFFCNYSSVAQKCPEIGEYLTLSVMLNKDTVQLGDEFELNVIFSNKKDSCVSFYPNALLSIVKPSGGFEFRSYFLNLIMNLKEVYRIDSLGVYRYTYNVQSIQPFFQKGINELYLYYLLPEQKGELKKYNELCGSLESDRFVIFIE